MKHHPLLPGPEASEFLWASGIEDTFVPQTRPGQRALDEYQLIGHYEHWREDLDHARDLGVPALRWGVPWYRVEKIPGELDWSWTDQVIPYMVEELKINLGNTNITSPVSGFVGKRVLDPGAWVTPNTPFISVVDIAVVRLIANIVEKDIRRITSGLPADVAVDAYPGEKFVGKVAHIAPVLDPATRTGQIEVEIANPSFRLKPGMYARVSVTTSTRI